MKAKVVNLHSPLLLRGKTGQTLRSRSLSMSFFLHVEWLSNLRCPGPFSNVQSWHAFIVRSKGNTTLVERLHPLQGHNVPAALCTFAPGLFVFMPSSFAFIRLAQPFSATSGKAREIGAIVRRKRGSAFDRHTYGLYFSYLMGRVFYMWSSYCCFVLDEMFRLDHHKQPHSAGPAARGRQI
jgi:hypothetical protein